jgi:hypothetical protein
LTHQSLQFRRTFINIAARNLRIVKYLPTGPSLHEPSFRVHPIEKAAALTDDAHDLIRNSSRMRLIEPSVERFQARFLALHGLFVPTGYKHFQ